jgi:hypothetical protein
MCIGFFCMCLSIAIHVLVMEQSTPNIHDCSTCNCSSNTPPNSPKSPTGQGTNRTGNRTGKSTFLTTK